MNYEDRDSADLIGMAMAFELSQDESDWAKAKEVYNILAERNDVDMAFSH